MKKNSVVLYTIGFTATTAENFFERLQNNDVKQIIDARLNTKSQLSGFAKNADLAFFLKKIINANYLHVPEFAPTQEILNNYRNKKIDWSEYENIYLNLIKKRRVEMLLNAKELDKSCLLCSEADATFCHRRLLAEYLERKLKSLSIKHL